MRISCALFIGFTAFFLFYPAIGWTSSGTEAASFLEIPVGAAPAALGSAYSALASDAYAPTWNPAGLGFLESPQLATQYVSYVEAINYEYASFVYPLGSRRALGTSIQYLGTGDIPATEVGGAPLGSYSSHFAAYSLAYGHALTSRLSLGFTGKLIDEKISDVSASAYAADFGALYRTGSRLSIAATLTNFGTKLNFLSTGDSLPLAGHLGAAYTPNNRWLAAVEGVYPKAGSPSLRFGAQWRALPSVALRAGYRTENLQELSALAGLSAGVGMILWGQEFAYAWVPMSDLGETHYISLVFKFGKREDSANLTEPKEMPPPSPRPVVVPSLEYGAPEAHPK